MTPREIFEQQGKLTKCPNPVHSFEWGRLLGQWQWAAKAWSSVTSNGLLETHYIKLSRQETAEGLTSHHLVIWRLNLHFAILPRTSQ